MRNSEKPRALVRAGVLVTAMLCASRASAQQQAQGFAADRFYSSAPGGGWFVMDTLDMRGGLGGAAGMTLNYSHNPLRVGMSEGSRYLNVVSDQAFADLGLAVTYASFRLYANIDMPLALTGHSGVVGGYSFTAPNVDAGMNPDSLLDVRIGFDARLIGSATSRLRLGVGAQLFVPNTYNAARADYDTDGSYRAMGRVLVAGTIGSFTYAGHVGVHVRPLDDSPTPGSPQGSELLFGVAGGVTFRVGGTTALVVGPEVYGASAVRSLFGSTSTALEGLLTGRIEGTAADGPQLRVKLGTGAGSNQQFGAPQWRLVFALELFDHHTDGDQDGISDSKDACPATPGIRTHDPRTNGCPSDRKANGLREAEPARSSVYGPIASDPKMTRGCPISGEVEATPPQSRSQDSVRASQ